MPFRDCINPFEWRLRGCDPEVATIGFVELAKATHRSPKSLMQMLGPQGNPQAQNLFAIVSYWLNREGIQFRLRAAVS